MSQTPEGIRAQLEDRIDRKLHQSEWAWLWGQGFVEEIIYGTGPSQLDDLVDALGNFPAALGTTQNLTRKLGPDYQALALSKILAIEARSFPQVLAFRQDVLGEKTLKEAEIATWLEAQTKREKAGPVSVQVRIPWNAGTPLPRLSSLTVADLRNALDSLPDNRLKVSRIGLEWEYLQYSVSGDQWAHVVPVDRDGVTGRLKEIAKLLSKSFAWQEAQAVSFVLSDSVPLVALATSKVILSSSSPRIQLTINPRVSSRRVTSFYLRTRREVLGRGKKSRSKPISERHAQLAIFLAENQSETWQLRMKKWNHSQQEWRYQDRRQFARDAKNAFLRVTGREWRLSTKGEFIAGQKVM